MPTASEILRERIETMGWPPFDRETGRLMISVIDAAERSNEAWSDDFLDWGSGEGHDAMAELERRLNLLKEALE